VLKHQSRILVGVLLAGDVAATTLAFLTAYYLRFASGLIPPPLEVPPLQQYTKIVPYILVLFIAVFALNGLYKPKRGRSRIDEFFSIVIASAASTLFIFLGLLYYKVYHTADVAPEWEFSRITLSVFMVVCVVFVSAMRFAIWHILEALQRRGYNTRNILVVGAGELGRTLVDRIVAHEEFGLRTIGFLDDDRKKLGSVYQGVRVIGALKDFERVLQDHRVDVLFVALPSGAYQKTLILIEIANRNCVEVRVVPDLLQYLSLKATVMDFDGLPIINLDQTPLSGLKKVGKRMFDISLSVIGLIITAAFFPFIALGIKLSSHGPILFKQERMGMDGKPFTLFKFRTMRTDAEPNGPIWAKTDDPRATPFGRLMRRTSLDELPQFWNVLRGEMSLVGPRPERPEFVQEFKHNISNYMLRHKVKAGMTGWAQVNGWRGNTSLKKRIEYDLYYVQNWSLAFDIKIIWLTISRAIFGRSQY
jgi:Undecaprenyl-phosphate glucose phosphotransferase